MIDWNNPKSLENAIVKTGLSVRAFAAEAGMSGSQIYRLLDGRFRPRFHSQAKIEKAFERLNSPKKRAKAA